MKIEHDLHTVIENLSKEYITYLQRLVQVPSLTGMEDKCQLLVLEKIKEIGLLCNKVYIDNKPPYVLTNRDYTDRHCIVGKLEGFGSSHFILNAHIDTAPVEDEKSWEHHPYGAVVEDNKLYGRGALDDKSGIAVMLLLAESFLRCGIKFPGNIYFESVIEDEDTGNGTLACTLAGYYCDAGIVIDGTGPFNIVDAHLGQIWLEFEISGAPKAACSCKKGVNPVEIAFTLIEKLKTFVVEKNKHSGSWLNIEEPCFLNLGKIHGGIWAGSVPERCQLEIQIGFPPSCNLDLLMHEINLLIEEFQKDKPRVKIKLTKGNLCTPSFSNHRNRFSRTIKKTVKRLRNGAEFNISAATGHSDLRHLLRQDGAPAEVCLYGPGGGENPHVRDEYYLIDHFVPVAQNIASSILTWYQII